MIHPLVSFFVENCFSQVSDNRGGERGWNKHKGLKNSRNNVRIYRRLLFFRKMSILPSSNTVCNNRLQKMKESVSEKINFTFNLIPKKDNMKYH